MSFARVDDPLTLAAASPAARRSAFPLLASLVPIGGGLVLWSVTGSAFALWFALLGPVIAAAALIDGSRSTRREARRVAAARAADVERVEREIARRHVDERDQLRAKHPDVYALATRGEEVWRAVGERADLLVAGIGPCESAVRVVASSADDAEAARLRAAAAVLEDGPVTVPWRRGIGIVGDPVRATAVLRGVILQLCLIHPPTAIRIVGATPRGWDWIDELPHRGDGGEGAVRLAVRVPGRSMEDAPDADVVLAWSRPAEPIDPRCGAVIEVRGLDDADLLVGSSRRALAVEAVAGAQARALARVMTVRARALYGALEASESVGLRALWRGSGVGARGRLAVAIGREGDAASVVDLVTDGPHAVVTGVTGSGKSELLTTWVSALCAAYSTTEVSFLLADFKGGTAFEALRSLPHVTGVITDLDGRSAARAIASLRAELRRRESALAQAGARDIADPRVHMPRLVIVVDEYAALLADHGGLQAVFADVAARGRALGLHLILGTQRATGVIRDGLLANVPLRISLRVADAADSRLMLGTDDAARLPGGVGDRGLALVRRSGDVTPRRLRVALTDADTIAEITATRHSEPRPEAPWLPPLPDIVMTEDLEPLAGDDGGIPLALVDEPHEQRRTVWSLDPGRDHALMVLGGPGAGKSGVARLCDAGARVRGVPVVTVPADPELGWDALTELGGRLDRLGDDERSSPPLVIMDDLDVLFARLSQEYAVEAHAAVDQLVRTAGETGLCLIVTAQRLTAPLARIAELIPQRALLTASPRADAGMSVRGDHPRSTGADPAFGARSTPGRAEIDGRAAQFALPPTGPGDERGSAVMEWAPGPGATVVLARSPLRVVAGLTDRGIVTRLVGDIRPGMSIDELTGSAPVVLVGDPEAWQQRWSLLSQLRAGHDIVIDAACPAEYRAVSGTRDLPPYARPGAGRGWLLRRGEMVGRVQLPQPAGYRPGM